MTASPWLRLVFSVSFLLAEVHSGCPERRHCSYSVEWSVDGGGESVSFELSGTGDGWVAVAFSRDRVMGGPQIDDVISCVRLPSTGEVVVVDGHNLPRPASYASVWDWPLDPPTVEGLSTGYDGTQITCSFRRPLLASHGNRDLPLNEPLYLFYARSDEPIGANGSLSKHTDTPWMSETTINVSSQRNGSFYVPSERTEIGYPEGCEATPTSCSVYLAQTVLDSKVLIELEGETPGWVAVGYSPDQRMGGDGIDDVVGCLVTSGTVVAKDTYNMGNVLNNVDDAVQSDIELLQGVYENGRLRCQLTRTKTGSSPVEDLDISDRTLFRFLGMGPIEGGPPKFGYHGSNNTPHIFEPLPSVATKPISVATCGVGPLLRAHGILMYLSWGVIAVVAIFLARHMPPALPNRRWIYSHQVLLLLALFCSVVGFVLVFVHFAVTDQKRRVVDFGVHNLVGSSHFVLGCVVMALQILNPVVGFFRPKIASNRYKVFRVIHGYVIGTVAQLIAAVVIFLGLYRYGNIATGSTHYPPFYLWAGFCAVVMAIEVCLKVYTMVVSRTDKSYWVTARAMNYKPKGGGGAKNSSSDSPASLIRSSPDSPLRWVAFAVVVTLTVVVGVCTVVLVGLACV